MRNALLFVLVLAPGSACTVKDPFHVGGDDAGAADADPDGADARPDCNDLIAFDRVEDGVYVVKPDGTGLRSLVASGTERHPVWSPDRLRVLFERPGDDGLMDIFVANADGSGIANLTDAPGDDTEPAWSPDATMIAFTTERNYTGSGNDVFVMNADGSSPLILASKARGSAWSPDGSRIALTSSIVTSPQIYTVTPTGSDLTNISNSTASDSEPLWSPDGTLIAYTSLRAGLNVALYLMAPDGSEQRNVTPALVATANHTWSPDSQRLTFEGVIDFDTAADVMLVSRNGGEVTNLTGDDPDGSTTPGWSPDGSQITYIGKRGGTDGDVLRINADGTGVTGITDTDFFSETSPSWSGCL